MSARARSRAFVGTHFRASPGTVAKFVGACCILLAPAAIFVFAVAPEQLFCSASARIGKILLNVVLIIFVNDTAAR
jgi:hypothetical protein